MASKIEPSARQGKLVTHLDEQAWMCRQHHLNTLVKFKGVVTRRTGVFPQLHMAKFTCVRCQHILGPFSQNNENEIKVGACPACQSKGPFEVCLDTNKPV